MTCNPCTRPDAARVTLIDGRTVCSYCEEWRHECEARAVMAMPTLEQRRAYLYGRYEDVEHHGKWARMLVERGIEQRRGSDAVKRLEGTMMELWRGRKGA